MPPTPMVVLEIDDNSPADVPAFTSEPSVWSFFDDCNLATRTGAETFRELHESVGASKFRGWPKNVASATLNLFEHLACPDEVTWFSAAELAGDRPWLPTGDSNTERSMRMLFETIDVAGRHFGADRVRLIFAFV